MNDAAPVIELTDISKTYGRGERGVRAVQGVSLSVGAGEVYGFLGPQRRRQEHHHPHAAGPDLAHRRAGAAARPHADEDPNVLRRVGSLVDGGNFYPFLSGRRNLEVLARTHGMAAADQSGRIDSLLEQVGLAGDGHRKVKGYSTGMRQRLGVAAALLNDPDVVILDEPANGLDAAGIQEMRFLIRRLAEQDGKAVFLSSHLLHEVQQLCDRVGIITKGAVVHESTIADLLRHDGGFRVEATPLDLAQAALSSRWACRVEGRICMSTRPARRCRSW
jgi:ABC-2 type transport system ATP-binding protein